jgi:hydroxymethylpyrimidine/phosphomethylpyrimidine kinase
MIPPVVLSIAGVDPSSGAGITADLKTCAAHTCYGISAITALTVQSTAGVLRMEPLWPELVSDTLFELAADLTISAVRIGMLGSGKVAEAVAAFLETTKLPNLVLDPVLRASSGAELLDAEGLEILKTRLLPIATVVTPNAPEAEALTGLPVRSLDDADKAANHLREMGALGVVIKGGHLPEGIDLLKWQDSAGLKRRQEFPGEKLDSTSTHGTGCAFSTSIACSLALGRSLPEAVSHAKMYVAEAIKNAYPLGRGTGPVNHLYRWSRS